MRDAGLRPTRQRVALADLLFAKGDRHLSAEELHEEALSAGVPVSLATVYNALHQFTDAGLLRILAVEGAKTYFDTNTSDHHHFFVEGENKVFDIVSGPVKVTDLPEPPEGMEIVNVDIVVACGPSARSDRHPGVGAVAWRPRSGFASLIQRRSPADNRERLSP